MSATHFKQVKVIQPDTTPPQTVIKLTPCSPGDASAIEKSWQDITAGTPHA
jgi:vacuolar protein-sorting-associated protein 4